MTKCIFFLDYLKRYYIIIFIMGSEGRDNVIYECSKIFENFVSIIYRKLNTKCVASNYNTSVVENFK